MRRVLAIAMFAIVVSVVHSATADMPGVRMHGVWCGPGNNPPLAPIDPLDGACYRHDMCYVMNGTGACGCDIAFMRELRAMAYPNAEVEVRARAMYDALAMMPCDHPGGWAVKQSLMWSDIAADAVNGRATPFEVPARWMYLFSRSDPYY